MPINNASRSRKSRSQRRGNNAELYAAVDLGTNNCRLLIARRAGETFRVVESFSQIVRLGEGLAASGRLSDASMARAISALQIIRAKLKKHRIGKFRCIATEACRKASNGADFIREVRAETGLSFRIINPREEAHLAAIGCHDLLEPDVRLVMVLDIGGGSTEISFVDMADLKDRRLPALIKSVPIKAWGSFPLGVVTLSESFSHLEDTEAYNAMRAHAHDLLAHWKRGAIYQDQIGADDAYIIGTSGTVTCLAGVHLDLQAYRRDRVDGVWLEPQDVRSVIQRLHSAGLEGRAAFPTIGAERAGLMMSGCAILETALSLWPAKRLRVADRGLREGLLLSMMHGTPRNKRNRRRRGKGKNHSISAVHTQQANEGAAS